ncbi:hypothetical protein ASG43_04110 [Aureimonas sp. Leaf454]|uniref:helix-turn-helix transcriptional regulator n=1 Tax=Aureimonas sp. Leaf454 TaxID=1736381 RepID=UPI0006FEF528|nr:helix-turn-helix domain-containing protein [Aureimonas sp. Leaf454]KQT54753.1 hypothetical protein ASG43_04110 [Aureimonas sp. Leaf454]
MDARTHSHDFSASPEGVISSLCAAESEWSPAKTRRTLVTSLDELEAFRRSSCFFSNASANGPRIDLDTEELNGAGFHLWRSTSESGFKAAQPVHSEPDLIMIHIVRKGSLLFRGLIDEHRVEAGFGLIVPLSDMAEYHTSDAHEAFGLVFDKALLHRHQLDVLDARTGALPEFEHQADLRTPALQSLTRNMAAMLSHRGHRTAAGMDSSLLFDMLLSQLVGAWPQRPARQTFQAPASSRHILRSLEFIEANLARQMSVAEVAKAAGIGVRALQSSFRRDVGRTPVQHIIDRRLQETHDELRRNHQSSIATIAARWGFVHMSDFSRRYRQRFGCTPSQTQIRSAGNV